MDTKILSNEMQERVQGVPVSGYDYKHQAWVINGRYYPCGHAGTEWPCNCYGRIHSGEPIAADAEIN